MKVLPRGRGTPSGSKLGPDVAGGLRGRREIEQLGQVDEPRPRFLDFLVDLYQGERARADVEQVVVDVDRLARQRVVDDRLESLLDIPGGGAAVAVRRGPGEVELGDLGRELALDVRLGERRALQLSAGGLGYAPDRDDAGDLDAGVLVDQVRGAGREREEVRHAAAMQDEQYQLIGRCAGVANTGGHDLAQLESRLLLEHCL